MQSKRPKILNFLKSALIVAAITFVCLNAGLLIVLNSPPVQRLLISQSNILLEKEFGVVADVQSFRVDVFRNSLIIKNFSISNKKTPVEKAIEIGLVRVKIDVLKSYIKRSIILSEVSIRGVNSTLSYDENGALKLPFNINQEKKDEKISIEKAKQALNFLWKNAPPKLELLTSTFKLSGGATNTQIVKLKSLRISKLRTPKEPFQIDLNLQESTLSFPQMPSTFGSLTIEEIKLQSKLTWDCNFQVQNIQISSNLTDITATGNLAIPFFDRPISYNFEHDTSINFQKAMSIFQFPATGQITAKGKLSSHQDFSENKVLSKYPVSKAKLNWNSLSLKSFNIYSGNADVDFKNLVVTANNLIVNFKNKGQVFGKAVFDLKNTLPFRADVKLKKISFAELMSGLTLNQNVMEFLITSEESVRVEGQMAELGKPAFEIGVKGKLSVSEMTSPQIHNSLRKSMPSLKVNLNLFSDMKHLSLENTSAESEDGKTTILPLSKANINYINGKSIFIIEAPNVSLQHAAYFLTPQSQGEGKLAAKLYTNDSKKLVLDASVSLSDANIWGTKFDLITGDFSLLPGKIDCRNLSGRFPNTPLGQSSFQNSSFGIEYATLNSSLQLSLQGELSSAISSVENYLPQVFQNFFGKLNASSFAFNGPINKPFEWKLSTQLSLENAIFQYFFAEKSTLRLDCNAALCNNSTFYAENSFLQIGDSTSLNPTLSSLKTSYPRGVLQTKIENLSLNNLRLETTASSFPIFNLSTNSQFLGLFGGKFSFGFALNNKSRDPFIEGKLFANRVNFQNIDFGSASFDFQRKGDNHFDIFAQMLNSQFGLRIQFLSGLSGASSLFLTLNNFDAFTFSEPAKRNKLNLYSRISTNASVQVPPFSEFNSQQSQKWISRIEGEGMLQKADIQVSQVRKRLTSEVPYKIDKGTLSFAALNLETENLNLSNSDLSETKNIERKQTTTISADVDFAQQELNLQTDMALNLSLLPEISNYFTKSQGELTAEISVEGPWKNLKTSGSLNLNAESILLKDYPPAITKARGSFALEDNVLRIESFVASKGDGKLEVLGSVNFDSLFAGKSEAPELALQISAKEIRTRFPFPFVEAFDLQASASLGLIGSSMPYKLKGDVQILRANAFRDATCQELVAEKTVGSPALNSLKQTPEIQFDLSITADDSISLQTTCVRAKLASELKVLGTNRDVLLLGRLNTSSGQVNFLKSRFAVQKADFEFETSLKNDPVVDILLTSKVESYTIYVGVEGQFSRRRTNLWVDPPSTPEGTTFTRNDIFRMLSTGKTPTSGDTTGQALASQVANFLYSATSLDDSLTLAFSKLTGGFIDNVELQPLIENGQAKWKARVSRALGERLTLGLDLEQGQTINNQSLNGSYLLNDTVNLLGGFDRKSEQSTQYYELSGGLRFQFGSKK